ncbi:MAG TPA: histidine phosphatase family protein [Baekduia sp.]|uniref:SixA phosphatase family protein n=1 Tax=Baekduia sp. TaxID=2600305 RepID=UPI002D769407|nr:histidine phosphatase family protein [Baekduia sp.]HET6510489.1 histidine phosphatase family protein [Baekduia sp.]
MANQLWLLRHGEAEPHDAKPDFDRELTERGRDQSRAAGGALAALELTFHAVYTSPRVRARDTALLACEALGEEPIVTPVLSQDFSVADARDLLLGVEPDGRILVVGHNPDFAQVVHDLTGARVDFKKGGVAGVRLEGTRGELVALLRPRELDRIAG